MRKLLTSTTLAAALLFGISAQAAMNNNASAPTMQNAPAMAVMTIEQVQGLGDNAPVMVEGMITQALGDEKYTFQDPTGATMVVEIDDDDWNGVKMNPEDMVIITGETDKNGNVTEIDVDTIALKNQQDN